MHPTCRKNGEAAPELFCSQCAKVDKTCWSDKRKRERWLKTQPKGHLGSCIPSERGQHREEPLPPRDRRQSGASQASARMGVEEELPALIPVLYTSLEDSASSDDGSDSEAENAESETGLGAQLLEQQDSDSKAAAPRAAPAASGLRRARGGGGPRAARGRPWAGGGARGTGAARGTGDARGAGAARGAGGAGAARGAGDADVPHNVTGSAGRHVVACFRESQGRGSLHAHITYADYLSKYVTKYVTKGDDFPASKM